MPKPATRALIVGASVVGLLLLLRRRRQRRLAARLASLVKLSLLPSERGPLLCMSPATSTVTFFRGPPYVAAASLSLFQKRAVMVDNSSAFRMLKDDSNHYE